jgi:glycerol uptake facilitator-like aquaporin
MMGVPSLKQKLFGEALGTALLLAAVVGSGIMAERLAGGNDAIALLGNTFPTGAILFVLITMLGPISGAHFNPAVTTIFWLRGAIDTRLAGLYVLVQIVGAIAGVCAAHIMFDLSVVQFSAKARAGWGQGFSELVATFGLVLTILLTLRAKPEAVPISVGLYITSAYWFTASTSFANPAVTIARALTDSFAGIALSHVPMFIAAQFAGAMLGLGAARFLADDTPRPLTTSPWKSAE